MLTVREVCDRLRCSRWKLHRLRKEKKLVPRKLGRSVVYSEAEVQRFENRLPAAR